MKEFFPIAIVFIIFSCSPFIQDSTIPEDSGIITLAADAYEINPANPRLEITTPKYNHFSADAFFQLSGSISANTEAEKYFLLEVEKGEETTSYWLTGDFKKNIWLRFGKGNYDINIYTIATIIINQYGVMSQWSHPERATWSIKVTNINETDGRLLYPSDFIQADNIEIKKTADSFTSTEPSALILEIHDWVVKYLYYDFDSAEFLNLREKQDAVSVLTSGKAVCEGYTALYNALLRAKNIPAQYVTGQAGGSGHAWSKVSDNTTMKYVDTTWDDPVISNSGSNNYPDGENLRHTYFWKDDFPDHIVHEEETTRNLKPGYPSVSFPGYPEGSY